MDQGGPAGPTRKPLIKLRAIIVSMITSSYQGCNSRILRVLTMTLSMYNSLLVQIAR